MKTPEEQSREDAMHSELPDGPELFRQVLFIENELDFEPMKVATPETPINPIPQPIFIEVVRPPEKKSVVKEAVKTWGLKAIGLIFISLIKRYLIKPRRPLHNPKED